MAWFQYIVIQLNVFVVINFNNVIIPLVVFIDIILLYHSNWKADMFFLPGYLGRIHRPGNRLVFVHCIELPEMKLNEASKFKNTHTCMYTFYLWAAAWISELSIYLYLVLTSTPLSYVSRSLGDLSWPFYTVNVPLFLNLTHAPHVTHRCTRDMSSTCSIKTQ